VKGNFLIGPALFALASVAVVLACGDPTCEDSGTCAAPPAEEAGVVVPTDEAGAPVGDFDLTIAAPASILVGTKGELEVIVSRSGARAITGDVTVTLEAQAGLTSAPLVIAGDVEKGTLVIDVALDRRHGDPKLVLKATAAGDKKTEAKTTTLIRGLPGSLDTSFGTDGTYTLNVPASDATGIAVQPDGKVVLGGRAGMSLALLRLNEDGTLDTSFNGGTTTITPPGTGIRTTADLVLDSKGGVAFLYELEGGAATIIKATNTGVLDASFGTGGIRTVEIYLPSALAIAADDTLYVGGRNPNNQPGQYVRKLLVNGAPDMTWGGGTGAFFATGPSPSPCGTGPQDDCRTSTLVVEPGGTLVACQNRSFGVNVHRVNADGTLGNLNEFSTLLDICRSIAANANTDFAFVGGHTGGAATIRRFYVTGVPLTPWGNEAEDTQFRAPEALIYGKRIANAAGKIILGAEDNAGNLAVGRLSTFGVLDTAFASTGYVTFKVGGKPSTLNAMQIDATKNRVVIAGSNGNLIAARLWL